MKTRAKRGPQRSERQPVQSTESGANTRTTFLRPPIEAASGRSLLPESKTGTRIETPYSSDWGIRVPFRFPYLRLMQCG